VLNMEEKPENPSSNWVCPPFYYYTSADAIMIDKAVEEGCAVDAPGSYVSWLAKTSAVFAMTMPGRRYDIGDLTSYNEVRENFPGITHHK